LVEDFPLLPPLRPDAITHNDYLKSCLASGKTPDGMPLSKERRRYFQVSIKEFDPQNFPDSIPEPILQAGCNVFGHICPAYFCAEPLTETKDQRVHSRAISRGVMLKVIRRDGQVCQMCFENVPDDKVEFDHLIPYSRGGASTVENIRLLCRDCNRKKTDSLKEILA
jgi:hypothetical protein